MSILKLATGLIQSLPSGVSTALETIGALSGTGVLEKTGAGAGDWALASPSPVKIWGNFNGTSTPGIRASSGVASFVRNVTGDYTVTFTNAQPDANYAVLVVGVGSASATSGRVLRGSTGPAYAPATTSIRFGLEAPGSGVLTDAEWIYFAVLR